MLDLGTDFAARGDGFTQISSGGVRHRTAGAIEMP